MQGIRASSTLRRIPGGHPRKSILGCGPIPRAGSVLRKRILPSVLPRPTVRFSGESLNYKRLQLPLSVHLCILVVVDCEWDPAKAKANARKHGIHFADAASALEDESALTIPDPHSEEERWITLGRDALGRVLVVIYTWRGERVRLISARPATPRERKQYEESHEA